MPSSNHTFNSNTCIIFAHRGASGYEFENTITAFDKAIQLGANGIETDCWLLKDGSVAIHHDHFVKKSENSWKNISKLTLDEIHKIKLPNGDYIPTIYEVFERYVNTKDSSGNLLRFSIDLQDKKVALPLSVIIQEFSIEDRVFLCSENLRELHKIHKCYPSIQLVASNIRRIVQDSKFPNMQYFKKPPFVRLYAINLQGKDMTCELSKNIHNSGYKLFLWDLHSTESIQEGMKFYPDAIYSDYPDLAQRILHHSTKSNNMINENS